MKKGFTRKSLGRALAGFMVGVLLLTGCEQKQGDTKVILTTGFTSDEVFRIKTISCTLPEIMVYLTTTQNQYENVYGEKIWSTDLNGVTLEKNVKEMVLAKIAQIKAMNLLAERHNVTLSDAEVALVKKAAKEYYDSLNDTEKEKMNVTENTIIELYREYALAEKLYHYIIKDINPEVSDDEARTITVEHILIKTYSTDANGEKVPYTDQAKKEAYNTAYEVLNKAKSGEDFDNLVSQYSEDSTSTYSFGKGEMDPAFEKAAFNLGTDEISDVVESEYGYHIIKCISTFNREETDANKVKIVEEKRDEVFGQEYDSFVASLNKSLNEELWNKVTFLHDANIKTSNFFQVYDTYFH